MRKVNQKGITLIALIITIIVLLILAAISVSLLTDENGIIAKAREGQTKYENASQKEADEIAALFGGVHKWVREGDTLTCTHCHVTYEIGETVAYTPTGNTSAVITVEKSGIGKVTDKEDNCEIASTTIPNMTLVGIASPIIGDQTIYQETDTDWVVLGIEDTDNDGINETLLITTEYPTSEEVYFNGANLYNNASTELDRICSEMYGNDSIKATARNMKVEDINKLFNYTPPGAVYYTGLFYTTGNLTTKIKDLPIWDDIKEAGTNTPDGVNTEEALGEYIYNGYSYYCNYGNLSSSLTEDTTYYTDANKANLIFGDYSHHYGYILSSKTVFGRYNTMYFGNYAVSGGEVRPLKYFASKEESSTENDFYNNFNRLFRPVVSLTAQLPSKNNVSAGSEEHNWTREGDTLTCSHCNKTYTIGNVVRYQSTGNWESIITSEKCGTEPEGTEAKNKNYQIASTTIPNMAYKSEWTPPIGDQMTLINYYTDWVVIGIEDTNKDGINETLLITSGTPSEYPVYFYGKEAYNYGGEELDRICNEMYASNRMGTTARNIKIEDINNMLNYTPSGGMYHDGTNYCTTGNFATKIKDLPIWNDIKEAGTNTPDGANTESVLGEYILNGYNYMVNESGYLVSTNEEDTTNPITELKNNIIFGEYEFSPYSYWISSKAVTAGENDVRFGNYTVYEKEIYIDGFYSTSDEDYLEYSYRPVVLLKHNLPTIIATEYVQPNPSRK